MSLSESEMDRREFLRNERQERSRQLRQQINNTRGRNCGFRGRRGARVARGARGPRGARIQDGSKHFVWSEEQTRRNLKNITSSVGPTRRGERRQAAALEYFALFFDNNVWNLILAMTNLNAQRKRAAGTDGGSWKDVKPCANALYLYTIHHQTLYSLRSIVRLHTT